MFLKHYLKRLVMFVYSNLKKRLTFAPEDSNSLRKLLRGRVQSACKRNQLFSLTFKGFYHVWCSENSNNQTFSTITNKCNPYEVQLQPFWSFQDKNTLWSLTRLESVLDVLSTCEQKQLFSLTFKGFYRGCCTESWIKQTFSTNKCKPYKVQFQPFCSFQSKNTFWALTHSESVLEGLNCLQTETGIFANT